MKKLLLLFALVAITASAAAQFKKAGNMEIVGRYNRGSITLMKHSTTYSVQYYIRFRDIRYTHIYTYFDPINLGDKENTIRFLSNIKNGWDDMNNGDEFPDLGLPNGESGYCELLWGYAKVFRVICDNLGNSGIICKRDVDKMLRTLSEENQ